MPRGVFVLGLVTAADVAAAQTRAEMDPRVAQGNALVADVRLGVDRDQG